MPNALLNEARRIAAILLALICSETATAEGWQTLPRCAVLAEQTVPVPAPESGVLTRLNVQKHEEVSQRVAIANLNTDVAEIDLHNAKLEEEAARARAADNLSVEFHQLAMEEAKQVLDNHENAKRSVNLAELNRLRLAYEKSKVALGQAKQAKQMAQVDWQLKKARTEAAQLRLARRTIHSPVSGTVIDAPKTVGQWVEAGETMMVIQNLENLRIDFLVQADALDLSMLQGAPARVKFAPPEGSPILLSGIVQSYDPQVSARGLIRVHVSLKNVKRNGHWVLLPGREVDLMVAAPNATLKSARAAAPPSSPSLSENQTPINR
ncbi:MAG: efflux RND transporter periplasmic adaptor subunit [Aureliella sp.]